MFIKPVKKISQKPLPSQYLQADMQCKFACFRKKIETKKRFNKLISINNIIIITVTLVI